MIFDRVEPYMCVSLIYFLNHVGVFRCAEHANNKRKLVNFKCAMCNTPLITKTNKNDERKKEMKHRRKTQQQEKGA